MLLARSGMLADRRETPERLQALNRGRGRDSSPSSSGTVRQTGWQHASQNEQNARAPLQHRETIVGYLGLQ
jgi:hypothetical protein